MRHSSCEQGFTVPVRQTMVKVDNEFKMNWASQRQCLREATRGRCVSGARVQRRQGLPRTKVEKTPPVPRDRSINQTVRNWSRSARRPRGTRSSECSDDCRSRVRSCRRVTNNSQEEIGVMNQEPSVAEQDHGARSQGRRERRWSGSPWKQGHTTT